jgi:hypothetical protein
VDNQQLLARRICESCGHTVFVFSDHRGRTFHLCRCSFYDSSSYHLGAYPVPIVMTNASWTHTYYPPQNHTFTARSRDRYVYVNDCLSVCMLQEEVCPSVGLSL